MDQAYAGESFRHAAACLHDMVFVRYATSRQNMQPHIYLKRLAACFNVRLRV